MKLNEKQKRLLQESIDIWKRDRVRLKKIGKCGQNYKKVIIHGREECPLCNAYWNNYCQDCPICLTTKTMDCYGTPYKLWPKAKTKQQAIKAHDEMINFMEGLLKDET